jgi:hypothetical protein
MKIFADGIGMTKHLLGLPVRNRASAGREEPAKKDGLLPARIAQTYPELIVTAGVLRDRRPYGAWNWRTYQRTGSDSGRHKEA